MNIIDIILDGISFFGYQKGNYFDDVIQFLKTKGVEYKIGSKGKIIRYDNIELNFSEKKLFMIQYIITDELTKDELLQSFELFCIPWEVDQKYTFNDQISILVKATNSIQLIIDKKSDLVESVYCY